MTLSELQYKIEVGLTVEFVHQGQKYIILGGREKGRSYIQFGKDCEAGQKYATFIQFMDEAMVGNQYLREYVKSL
ncbi:MAG: hypothetical protein J6V90_06830 [Treponema sp.]|nr:hypothetical protein [Treponema sp.]